MVTYVLILFLAASFQPRVESNLWHQLTDFGFAFRFWKFVGPEILMLVGICAYFVSLLVYCSPLILGLMFSM